MWFVLAVLPLLLLAAGSAAAAGLETVLLEDEPFGGTEEGLDFRGGRLNLAGQVLFTATHPSWPGGRLLLLYEGPAATTWVAVPGQMLPGAAAPFVRPDTFTLNDEGVAAFTGHLENGTGGLWLRQPGGSLIPVALPGDPAPGTGGLRFRTVSFVVLSEGGWLAFRAFLETAAGDPVPVLQRGTGVWVGQAGALQLVALYGDPPPGRPPGSRFQTLLRLALNAQGELVMGWAVADEDDVEEDGIWRWSPSDGLELALGFGLPLPGVPGGGSFASRVYPGIDDAGRIAFEARTVGSGGASVNGIWGPDENGELALLASEDAPVPGFPEEDFDRLWDNPDFSRAGEVAFRGGLPQRPEDGNYLRYAICGPQGAERVTLIAADGHPVPGLPSNLRFRWVAWPSGPWVDSAGDVAFEAAFGPPNEVSGWGLFLSDRAEGVRHFLLSGATLEVRPGDRRVVSVDAGDGGHKIQGLNDAGQVLIRADLELAPDGFPVAEGVFLGTPDEFRAAAAANVPALSPRGRVALAVALLAVFLLGLRRR